MSPETGVVKKTGEPPLKDDYPFRMTMKKKILFVCIENSNRSQMSQAFAKSLAEKILKLIVPAANPVALLT